MWPQLKDLIQGGFLETVVFDAVFPKPWPLHPMKSCLFLKYPIPTLSHPPCLKAIPHKLPLLTSVPLLPTQCLNLLSDHHLLVLLLNSIFPLMSIILFHNLPDPFLEASLRQGVRFSTVKKKIISFPKFPTFFLNFRQHLLFIAYTK